MDQRTEVSDDPKCGKKKGDSDSNIIESPLTFIDFIYDRGNTKGPNSFFQIFVYE